MTKINREKKQIQYFKGIFHCHSNKSDGEANPVNVAKYYKFIGYDFLGISDHNSYTDINLWSKQADILGIPCSEYTGEKFCHILAIGTTQNVKPDGKTNCNQEHLGILQDGINKTIKAAGIPVICHPFWHWALNAEIIKKTKFCTHFEICNASPDCNSFPLPGFEPGEDLWDELLSSGRVFYGMANDDAHQYYSPHHSRSPSAGRSFNAIFAKQLSLTNILNAIKHGNFFASTGIELKRYEISKKSIEIEVDEIAYEKTIIEFISYGGKKLKIQAGPKAEYQFKGNEKYIRIRIGSTAGLWLWTQPVFLPSK